MGFLLVGWSALDAAFWRDGSRWVPAAAAAFSACITPVLVATVAVGRADLMTSVVLFSACWSLAISRLGIPGFAEDAEAPVFHWMMVGIAALMAIGSIVEGTRQHLRYRALERRLAALRSAAP
jgi:hypothetical protein